MSKPYRKNANSQGDVFDNAGTLLDKAEKRFIRKGGGVIFLFKNRFHEC